MDCQVPPQMLLSFSTPDEFIFDQIAEEDVEAAKDCSILLDQNWNVFSCTPLHNFLRGENNLLTYGQTLARVLKQKHNITAAKCIFELVPVLAFTEKDDTALKVTVESAVGKKSSSCCAFLISRDSKFSKDGDGFMQLPVLLFKGPKPLTDAVTSSLESIFDASISAVVFSAKELLMMGICSCLQDNLKQTELKLRLNYRLPDTSDTEKDSIQLTYAIDIDDFKDLWKSMYSTLVANKDIDIVQMFHKELQTHFINVYNIDLSFFILNSIDLTGFVRIDKHGKMKCKLPETFHFMLKYLTRKINYETQI